MKRQFDLQVSKVMKGLYSVDIYWGPILVWYVGLYRTWEEANDAGWAALENESFPYREVY